MSHINVQDHASLVILQCSFSWGTVLDQEITDETTHDKGAVRGALRVRKTLLPSAAGYHVNQVQAELGKFYAYHKSKTYATAITGQRIMPVVFHLDYMQELGAATAKVHAAMDALVSGYPTAVVQAQTLLGTSFKAGDYPDVAEIGRYCKLDVDFLPVPSGDHIMKALGAGVAANVDTFVEKMMKSAAADAKQRLLDAVKRMADLQHKKKIYASMTDSINELARELPVIAGLSNDPELNALVAEVTATLTGYDADDFRKSDLARSKVGAAAMDILKRMGG